MANSLILTREQLEDSKIYVPEKLAVNFKHPMEYFEPILNQISDMGASYTIEAVEGSKNKEKDSEEVEGVTNIAYKRLLLKAKLPTDYDLELDLPTEFNHLTTELGIMLILDGLNPEMKVYRGKRVVTCMNTCIFGSEHMRVFNMIRESHILMQNTGLDYINSAKQEEEMYLRRISTMYSTKHEGENKIMQRIGEFMYYCKENKSIGINLASEVLGELQNTRSRYFINKSSSMNDWELYNTASECLKSNLDEASKMLQLEPLFNYN